MTDATGDYDEEEDEDEVAAALEAAESKSIRILR